jgi:phosphopantothenoylcysteine decarboxylase/phosphopantothenate--cysteine ligase
MHVIVGITGGIAAYKATSIIRLLTEAGHTVKVIPTQNALRFIGATTLEALSHNTVDPDLYTDVESVKHVALGQEADLVIVAPASASFLARYAAGIADDLLGNTLLVTKAPVVVAPAMHTEMWLHAATQQNVKTLSARGVHVLEPAVGRLTGEDSGIGRLPEPEEVVEYSLAKAGRQDLAGQRFLISAGGTREEIDPVRFIGNKSSGKQGIAIALEALQRGASVTLIAANISSIPSEIQPCMLLRMLCSSKRS